MVFPQETKGPGKSQSQSPTGKATRDPHVWKRYGIAGMV